MKTTIREAQKKDIPAITSLMSELLGHEMSSADMEDRLALVANSPIDELYVIELGSDVKGLLGFRIRENIEEASRYGEISVIVTDPSARKMGIGRELISFAEQHAAKLKCKGTWLVSGFGREEDAHKFYKRLGYEITGYRFVKKFEK